MVKAKFLAALVVTSAVIVLAPRADAATVSARQRHQQLRIAHGLASGALTVREGVRLQVWQLSIARQEARMRADDDALGPRERAVLQHRLDRASAAIWRQKHDRQHR